MATRIFEEERVEEEVYTQVEEVEHGALHYLVPIGVQGNEVLVVPLEIISGEIIEGFITLA